MDSAFLVPSVASATAAAPWLTPPAQEDQLSGQSIGDKPLSSWTQRGALRMQLVSRAPGAGGHHRAP